MSRRAEGPADAVLDGSFSRAMQLLQVSFSAAASGFRDPAQSPRFAIQANCHEKAYGLESFHLLTIGVGSAGCSPGPSGALWHLHMKVRCDSKAACRVWFQTHVAHMARATKLENHFGVRLGGQRRH